MVNILKIIDIALTCVFILEVIIKMVGLGVIMNGKDSYLRDPWNIIDVCIIILSVSLMPINLFLYYRLYQHQQPHTAIT
jgi:hypothetical protein